MIKIDNQSSMPIYEQIIKEIKRNIFEGKLKAEEQIPSIRQLAQTLGVNPNTVKKSYTILENEKIIITRSTKGTFITSHIDKIVEEAKEKCYNIIECEIKELKKLKVDHKEILERISR